MIIIEKNSPILTSDTRIIGITMGSDLESVKTEDFEKQFYDKFVVKVFNIVKELLVIKFYKLVVKYKLLDIAINMELFINHIYCN